MAMRRFRVLIVAYEGGLFGFILVSTQGEAFRFLFRHWPGPTCTPHSAVME
jgi:hypothetical protein